MRRAIRPLETGGGYEFTLEDGSTIEVSFGESMGVEGYSLNVSVTRGGFATLIPRASNALEIYSTRSTIKLDLEIDAAVAARDAAKKKAKQEKQNGPLSAGSRCPRCLQGTMHLGRAIEQTLSGALDFIGDKHPTTISPGGPGRLVDCLKCDCCGYSVTR